MTKQTPDARADAPLTAAQVDAIVCPRCGEVGRVEVFAPTGHVLIVHPGRVDADGARWADDACILSTDEGMALLDAALAAPGAGGEQETT